MSMRILFRADFFAVDGAGNSRVLYRAGESYEVTDETTRLVAAGIADAVEVTDAPEPAEPTPVA